ncbi:KH domain-containing protein, partial [Nanoarchaeota archaeon]
MIEKKIIALKKDEYAIKEFIKKTLGKGRLSGIKIERTPLGERVIVTTSRPGGIIGKKGVTINLLTENLKSEFKLQNPKIEIAEVSNPEFDSQTVADQMALQLERFGTGSFKIVAYRAMDRIKKAGAL